MSNNLAGLNSKLDAELLDTADSVWTSAMKDEYLTEAVDDLWPRFSRTLEPSTTTVALVAATYRYSLPAGVCAVSRIDLLDASGTEYGSVNGRAWEVSGDLLSGTGKLHIGAAIVDGFAGGSVQLVAYGKYDVTTNLIPNDLIELVIARARAKAYRQLGTLRANFKVWLSRNQVTNITVNELIHLINESDAEANRLEAKTPRTWQRPVPGRVG